MKLAITTRNRPGNRSHRAANQAGFTLAEVLAALLFLAIVIPTAVEAVHVASLAGEVAARKSGAVRVAERVLNESLVTTNWTSQQSGTVTEGVVDYQWKLTSQTWPQEALQQVTSQVTFTAQGRNYSVSLSTLANSQPPPAATTSSSQQ